MALTDYVVRMRGEDELSGMIQNVGKSLKDTGAAATRLDEIQRQFKRMTESSAPAKRQIRDIQKLLGEMNLKGLNATPLFTEMAEYAGTLKDSVSDAGTAINAFANDTFKLQATAQAFQVVAGSASLVTGAMGLLGGESEKVQRVMLKVQSAIALVNGVQSIANLLNKDSALMLRLKQIRLTAANMATATNTAATTANSAATKANTVATGTNTAATVVQTKAKEGLNYAIAVGKALVGDWTGLLLVGATALAGYAIATAGATEEQEQQTKAINHTRDAFSTYSRAVGTESGNLVGQFKRLCIEWNAAKTSADQLNTVLPKVQEFFKGVGIEIKNVNDANRVLVENSDKVVRALELQAQARGAAAASEEYWKKYYSDQNDRNQMPLTFANTDKSGNLSSMGGDSEYAAELQAYVETQLRAEMKKYGAKEALKLLDKGLIAHVWKGTATGIAKEWKKNQDEQQKKAAQNFSESMQKEVLSKESEADKIWNDLGLDKTSPTTTSKPSTRPVSSSSSTTADEIKYEADSLADLEAQLKALDEELKNTNPSKERIAAIAKERASLEDKISKRKEELGLAKAAEEAQEGSIKAYQQELSANKKALQENASLTDEEIAKLKARNDELEKTIENLEILRGLKDAPAATSTYGDVALSPGEAQGGREDRRVSYNAIMSDREQLISDANAGIIDTSEALRQIAELDQKLEELGMKPPVKIKIDKEGNLTEVANASEKLETTVAGAGQAVQGLGQAMANLGADGAMAKTAAITAAIGSIVLSFAKVLGKSVTPWDWIAASVAGVATLTGLVSQIKTFQEGGIVGGASYTGDNVYARLNSGEMVLNKRQQSRLWNLIDGTGNTGGITGGNVVFTIKGSDLVGTINNYNSKRRIQS